MFRLLGGTTAWAVALPKVIKDRSILLPMRLLRALQI